MFKYIDFLLELNLVVKSEDSQIKVTVGQLQTFGILQNIEKIED